MSTRPEVLEINLDQSLETLLDSGVIRRNSLLLDALAAHSPGMVDLLAEECQGYYLRGYGVYPGYRGDRYALLFTKDPNYNISKFKSNKWVTKWVDYEENKYDML